MIRETDSLTNSTQYGYDPIGNRTQLIDANGNTTTFVYDDANQLTDILYPDETVTFTYDDAGQRTDMNDSAGLTHWVYDDLGRATSITDPFNTSVIYGYDAVGNRTSVSYPGYSVGYTYDPANLLQDVTWGQSTTSYTYNAANRVTNISRPNGVQSTFSYDPVGRIAAITHQTASEVLASYAYTMDNVGNRVQVVERQGKTNFPTPTPSLTPTHTNTPPPTFTSTATLTASPTNTATATQTSTFTLTPSETPTPTVTYSPTATPTITDTPIPPTPTDTDTPVPPTNTPSQQTLQVTKTEDTYDGVCDSDCSLRDAVAVANSSSDLNIITIPAGTYILTLAGSDDYSGDINIRQPIILDGDNALNTIITGGPGWSDRILSVLYVSNIELHNLTISGGNTSTSNGGGILINDSNLILNNVVIDGNIGSSAGGIFVNIGSSLTITDSAIINNVADFEGGGVANMGTLTITNSTISGNSASRNGGGIHNGNPNGTFFITNTTITNNTSGTGGVVGDGGGIYTTHPVTIKNTLIAGNIDVFGAPKDRFPDCAGTGIISSQGHNLIGNNNGCTISSGSGDQIGTKQNPINPVLGALQDNGGNTQTHALLSGSPAINAGDNNGCPATDQRGYTRDASCDIGAYEYNAPLGMNPAVANQPAQNSGSFQLVSYPLAGKPPTKTSTPSSTPSKTLTPSSTPTPSNTPGPTPTWDPSITQTGYKPATTYSGTGFEENPSYALLDDGLFAVDHNTGNATTECAIGASSDTQTFKTFDMQVPAGVKLTSVDVRTDAKVNDTTNSPKLCVYIRIYYGILDNVYWSPQTINLYSTNEQTYYTSFGGVPDIIVPETVGSKLNIIVFSLSSTPKDFSLDYVAANVHWQYPPTPVTPSNTPTVTSSPTLTPTITPSPTRTPRDTATPIDVPTSYPATPTATREPTSVPTDLPTPLPGYTETTINYVYDPLHRLTEANYSTGVYYHYAYDAVGNRLSQETALGTTNYIYDNVNRLTSVNGVNYTWDNNGNLLNDGVNTYTYTSNKLSSISGENLNVTFQYRCNGESIWQSGCESDRVSQTVNGVTTNYVLDIASPLTQVLQDGTNTYLYGIDRIAQISGATPEYFLTDGLGSVRQLVDSAGNITLAKGYQPYGTEISSTGSSLSSYGFTGEMTDPTGLIYLRARYYDPTDGRFFQKDPSRQEKNLYQYAGSNPIMYTDPSGLVYLTFDDGPNYPADMQILTILAQHKARATFFFHGSSISPSTVDKLIVWRVVTEGHHIGNHGWSPEKLTDTDVDSAIQSVADTENLIVHTIRGMKTANSSQFNSLNYDTQSYINGVIEHGTGLFRPHGGYIKQSQLRAIECKNIWGESTECDSRLRGPLDVSLWDVAPRDWEAHNPKFYSTDPSEILSRLCNGVWWDLYSTPNIKVSIYNRPVTSNSDVILLHSYEETASVLPEILDTLSSMGYTFDVLEPSWR